MEIANHPPEPSCGGGIRSKSNLEHGLIFLGENVSGGIALKNRRVVSERRFEIEAKFPAVLRHPTPAALREREPLHRDADRW